MCMLLIPMTPLLHIGGEDTLAAKAVNSEIPVFRQNSSCLFTGKPSGPSQLEGGGWLRAALLSLGAVWNTWLSRSPWCHVQMTEPEENVENCIGGFHGRFPRASWEWNVSLLPLPVFCIPDQTQVCSPAPSPCYPA